MEMEVSALRVEGVEGDVRGSERKADGIEHLHVSERRICVFDLDGTLSDLDHRLHLAPLARDGEKPDWEAFSQACDKDGPIRHTIELTKTLSKTYDIWIVTGRSASVADKTVEWLREHGVVFHNLIMRNPTYHAPGSKLKEQWLESGLLPKDKIVAVFEDQPSVVAMWGENGVPCFQVQRKVKDDE